MAGKRQVKFATHAELKNIIGQDLINDDNIAVIELVKNGLDAGSPSVFIDFRGTVSIESAEASILIKDVGSGMSDTDITGKWLNIAYSEKKYVEIGSRLLAGNKGVGRFACDRLGKTLDLYTRRNKKKTWLHLYVDWKRFEGQKNSSTEIQSIGVELEELSDRSFKEQTGEEPFQSGTVLLIKSLRSTWDRDKLLGLRRYLGKFVEPNAAFNKASYSIHLQVLEQAKADSRFEPHEKINGDIRNEIFDRLKFHTAYIESSISADAKTVTTELHYAGKRVYRIGEENTEFPLLANTRVVIHYMNQYQKGYFKRQTGLNAVEFGSMFLFLNGYRVPPYGDRDNDWLRLDNRKNQQTMSALGSREVIGRIELYDQEGRFRVVSNREGIARGPAFMQLVGMAQSSGYFYKSLKRLERFVVNGLGWDSLRVEDKKLVDNGLLPGDKGQPRIEQYVESLDTKRRRVALNVLQMLNAKPATTLELSIDPQLFDTLKRERDETVSALVQKISAFSGKMDHSLKSAITSIGEELENKKRSLEQAEKIVAKKGQQLERLREAAKTVSERAKTLQARVSTQEKEILFSRRGRDREKDELMLLHHHAGIYANTARNNVGNAIDALNEGDTEQVRRYLAKVLRSIQQIHAVTDFATKVQFKAMSTDKIHADLAGFIEEYVTQVLSSSAVRIKVSRDFAEPFEMRFKPFDMAIVIENLVNNVRSGKNLSITLARPATNELLVLFEDDGSGLSKDIQPPQAIFNLGVTTTAGGSGMGLFHVKEIVTEMKGEVSLPRTGAKGFSLQMRFFS